MHANVEPLDAMLSKMAQQKAVKKTLRARNAPVNIEEPAHSIIVRLGGVRQVSRHLGISAAAVTRWQSKKTETNKRGANGIIPQNRRAPLLALAKSLHIKLFKYNFVK